MNGALGILVLLATNAIAATALLGLGLLADRFLHWPAVRHLVWVAVLLQLLLPSVVAIGVSLPEPRPVDAAAVTAGAGPAPSSAGAEASLAQTVQATRTVQATQTTQSGVVSLATALVAIELTGAALFLGLASTRLRRMAQLLRATEPAPDSLEQRARRLADRLRLRRLPRLRVTDERIVPMLVALPIPTIVLSRPLVEALGSDEIDALLCHELAHVKRGDAWLRPVEMLATALYWWLPTLWVARRRLRRAEEAACDSVVVSVDPASKRAYAEGLLRTIELTTPVQPSTLVTGSADSRHIKERIAMILDSSDKQAPRGVLRFAVAVAAIAVLVGPAWSPAQPAREQAENEAGATGAEPAEERQERELERVEAQRRERALLERELIEMRMQAYVIENEIAQHELRSEIARISELLEYLSAAVGQEAEADEAQRSLDRLELQSQHLDVQLSIRRLERQLELQANDLVLRGGGAPVAIERP